MRVVAPAAEISRLDWLTNDEQEARAEASELAVDVGLAVAPDAASVDAEVGDTDPVQAIEDALREFPADELVLVTHPDEDASLARGGHRRGGAGPLRPPRHAPRRRAGLTPAGEYTESRRGVSSAGRAPALQAGGHRFDPGTLHRLVTSQGFGPRAPDGTSPLHARPSLQMPGRRRTVPLRRVGATALGTLRRALVAGSEVGRQGEERCTYAGSTRGFRGWVVAALAALVTLVATGQALAQAPWNGLPISPGLGPTYGETWCADPAAEPGIAPQQGPPLALIPYGAIRCTLDKIQDEASAAGLPQRLTYSVVGQTAGGRDPLRSRGQRPGDAGAAPRLQALPRSSASSSSSDPRQAQKLLQSLRRRRQDADLHRGQHPRERGRGRRRDDAGDPRPRRRRRSATNAIVDEHPRPLDPRDRSPR